MTDLSEVKWYISLIRSFFAVIDKLIYNLITGMYDIFSMVAGAEVRTGEVVQNFFSRIQLILGIIILFKLVISLFSGIVDPDGFSDNKKGFGNVIKRVVVVLVMLLLIIPLNIPEKDIVDLNADSVATKKNSQKTWNTRMNESGILFGTMGEIQSRIIKGNVISKLVLGVSNQDMNADINSSSGDSVAMTLMRSFVFINLETGHDNPFEKKKMVSIIEYVN